MVAGATASVSAAAGLAALAVAALIALFMLRPPYRDPHGGDSVVPHPETWWDVAFGLSLVTALALVALGLLALALALAGVVLTGEPASPLRRRGPRLTVLAVGAATYLLAVPVVLTAAGLELHSLWLTTSTLCPSGSSTKAA